MASSPPAPSRPPLPPQPPSNLPRDFSAQNGRPSPLGPQSPQTGMSYSTSSPQAFSPQQYFQPPAAKRPRLSPELQSPSAPQSFPGTPTGQPGPTPANVTINGTSAPAVRPSNLMPPPQRPPEKEDRSHEDIFAGTGINIEEESRLLVQTDFFAGSTTTQPGSGSVQYQNNSFAQTDSIAGTPFGQADGQTRLGDLPASEEELKQRDEDRKNWEAARHSQNPLWDLFLLGGALNERIRNISITEHLVDPQSGVLVNTQKHMPPPVVRVNGLEGASRIIDKGQAILDTGVKGERLANIMKAISLATKSRLTGLLSASSRLAKERRQHSSGKVPDEWQDIAVRPRPANDVPNGAPSPAGSSSLKRTHSQANSEAISDARVPAPVRLITTLDKTTQTVKSSEEARRQRRLKRRTAAKDDASATPAGDSALDAAAAALDAEKKTTKKERKLAESKFTEQQQHKSANEAARMAVAGILGNRKKAGRTFDWMNAGKGGASPLVTPGRPPPPSSGPTSTAGTPGPERPRAVPKDKQLGQWNEDIDANVQGRDVLLVLEGDGRALRSYLKGLSLPEKNDS